MFFLGSKNIIGVVFMANNAPTVYSFIPPSMHDAIVRYYETQRRDDCKEEKFTCNSVIASIAALNVPKIEARNYVGKPGNRSFIYNAHRGDGGDGGDDDASPKEVWNASSKRPVLVLSSTGIKNNPDNDAYMCYDNMVIVDNFFRKKFSVHPVKDSPHLMRSYVHSPLAFNNAYWRSDTQTVYFGEVDPQIFSRRFVNDLGVTTHEWTHAVTHFSSNLIYRGQSGALNESISDVFAVIIKQLRGNYRANDQDADWFIGKGIITGLPNGGLRSLEAPGTAYKNHPILGDDPQPDHMNRYNYLPENQNNDWGGVHINSGIPNKAFYLAAKALQGYSWDKVGKIWYLALKNTRADANFSSFAFDTLDAVKQLNFDHNVYQCVAQAWKDVGVDLRGLGGRNQNGIKEMLLSKETAIAITFIGLSVFLKYRCFS